MVAVVGATRERTPVSKAFPRTICTIEINGSIFGKRDLLAIDHIMLALFWSYVPNMK